ncbi:rhodanese-like domain-containing protein [Temperatibacter marinus]|uniref:Sulfurtransferase n=1 Tax=Temperatibacter marinus TaxID=1456591 RepID=A0AA52H9J7_9PROT|nr:rhodanese-like domain-containing protein [Temperatibacter marinus]WND02587.1 rhodanese-like domain-containing protein [Temperatibacter marinus]
MGPLVSTDWVHEHLTNSQIKLIDCSWHMPATNRSGLREFETAHIQGAQFLDIDSVADQTSTLPHMMPSKELFQSFAESAGLTNQDTIILYDNSDLRTAARGRMMFLEFGHGAVYVMNGGLQKWVSESKPVCSNPVKADVGHFEIKPSCIAVASLEDMCHFVEKKDRQILDARSHDRFSAKVPEPREGLKSGHMPGALNVPFTQLIQDDGTYHGPEFLEQTFKQAGLNFSRPAVTSCGSGITACVVGLALEILEKKDVAIYDGSWSEWGAQETTPVEKG